MSDNARGLTILTKPVPDSRFRFTKTGRTYTTAKVKNYKWHIAHAAAIERGTGEIWTGPLKLYFRAVMPIPRSWPKWKQYGAEYCGMAPASVPDLDNLAKAAIDALQGVWFKNDSQIVNMELVKAYGPLPGINVVCSRLEDDGTHWYKERYKLYLQRSKGAKEL